MIGDSSNILNLSFDNEIVKHIYLSIYGSIVLLLDFGSFFSFLIMYTVGMPPWMSDQPVARPLPTHRTTQTENKRTQRHPCLQ
jgi:hypothetical protein